MIGPARWLRSWRYTGGIGLLLRDAHFLRGTVLHISLARRAHLAWTYSALLAAVVNCAPGENDTTAPVPPTVLRAALTSNAASSLNEQGQFRLAGPPVGARELSSTQAVQIAAAWARQFAPKIRRTLERERGGPIALERLTPCGRPLYAESAFEPLPADLPAGIRRSYESNWLVGLCAGTELQVSLAIASGAADLAVVNGAIQPGAERGGEFFSLGVPSTWESPVGLAPERAAQLVSQATGRLITQAPKLVSASPRAAYPQGSTWEFELESSVAVRKGSRPVTEQAGRIHTGFHARVGLNKNMRQDLMLVGASTQPTELSVTVPIRGKNDVRDAEPTMRTFTIRPRSDVPVLLVHATFPER